MRWRILALALGLAWPAGGSAQQVTLSVSGNTDVEASLDVASSSAQPLVLSGGLDVSLVLTQDVTHGLVAQSVEFTGGSLSAADVVWELSDALASIDASLTDAAVEATSGVLAATPVAFNTAEFPSPPLDAAIAAGLFAADGTSLGVVVDVDRDFSTDPAELSLGGASSLVTTPGAGAAVEVVLTIPVATALPLSDSSCVPWMQLDGVLVLRGNIGDSDADGVIDAEDNCVEVPNPGQEDFDAGQDDDSTQKGVQHYGDACDVDLDDDGLVGASDFFRIFRPCLGADLKAKPQCEEADLDGDGVVAASDFFAFLRPALGSAPGPGVTE